MFPDMPLTSSTMSPEKMATLIYSLASEKGSGEALNYLFDWLGGPGGPIEAKTVSDGDCGWISGGSGIDQTEKKDSSVPESKKSYPEQEAALAIVNNYFTEEES